MLVWYRAQSVLLLLASKRHPPARPPGPLVPGPQEGLSSRNPELQRTIQCVIERIVRTLTECRDALYKYLIASK